MVKIKTIYFTYDLGASIFLTKHLMRKEQPQQGR